MIVSYSNPYFFGLLLFAVSSLRIRIFSFRLLEMKGVTMTNMEKQEKTKRKKRREKIEVDG